MKKPSTPQIRTHFEQISVALVKEIARRRAAETKLTGPGNKIARSTAGKTAPPPSNAIAERLRQQTRHAKASRKLLAAPTRTLKRKKG